MKAGLVHPRTCGAGSPAAPRALTVVLHDVAPARWDGCLRVLAQVRIVAARAGVHLPVTLLVVPRWHGQRAVPPVYLRWLQRLARSGHELALHGLTHKDEVPARDAGRVDRLRRRVYTAGEGEFAALARDEAAARIALARRWSEEHGLAPMRGFVAPAWLLSEAAFGAVRDAGFDHTCTLARVWDLRTAPAASAADPAPAALEPSSAWAPSLVFGTRAAWRRVASVAYNGLLAPALALARVPLLRLELHPDDADHEAVRRCWTGALESALAGGRVALTLGEAAAPVALQPAPASSAAAYSLSRL